jgi:hypothetical protein
VVGVIGATLSLLLPPTIGFIAPASRMPLALISTALAFSATIYLLALVSSAAIFEIVVRPPKEATKQGA